jgi:transcriptional regulator with XRE-family HTH domain
VRELARLLDVSASVIEGAENGSVPQPRNAKKLADFYGYRVTDVWPVDDERPEAAA